MECRLYLSSWIIMTAILNRMQAIFILFDHYDSYPEWNAGYIYPLQSL